MAFEKVDAKTRARLRELVDADGLASVVRESKVGRDPIQRVLADLEVRPGTVLMIERYVASKK